MGVGVSPEKQQTAEGVKAAGKGNQAPKDTRDITIRDAYEALVHLLTSDSTKTLVCANVYYDPEKFGEESVMNR